MSNGADGPADIIGKGWKFPVKVNASGGLNWSNGPDRVMDAVWLILNTVPDERVMRPTFGAGARSFVFEPNSVASRARLSLAISEALTKWEPRIEVVSLDVAQGDDPNIVSIAIAYKIRTTNELFNLVFPFYLQEGAG